MRPYTQAFLHVLPTTATLLAGVACGDSDNLMTSSFSLVFQDTEKRRPACVIDALAEMAVARHSCYVQVLYADTRMPFCVVLGGLEMEVAALASDGQVLLGDRSFRLLAPMAALYPTVTEVLRFSQSFLPAPRVTWVLHHVSVRVGQKHLQAHIQPDSAVRAGWLGHRFRAPMYTAILVMWFRLTDDERIPMIVGAQDEMRRDGSALQWAMQFDFERLT